MASSATYDLGADMEKLAKIFNACKQMQEIESEIIKTTENLRSIETDRDKINVNLPSLEPFFCKIRDCIESSESLSVHMKSINESHSECIAAFQLMAETQEINENQLKTVMINLERIIAECEKFGSELGNFNSNLRDLQRISDGVKEEALKEQEKFKKEAASTRSEAKWKSAYHWYQRIITVGLINLNSNFQQDVSANDERYRKADRLDNLSEKFRQARMSLDVAAKTVGEIFNRMGDGAIKLTKELIAIITKVLAQYKYIASLQQKLHEKDEEIARLTRALEEANKKN